MLTRKPHILILMLGALLAALLLGAFSTVAQALPDDDGAAQPGRAATGARTTRQTNPAPAYVRMRGQVVIDQAVCHYGPGAPYLYKYGVYKGSNLEVLRRVLGGNYIEVQAIGGNNPCWVRADYLALKGDWLNLEPVRFEDVRLPVTPYYAPPGGVSARRDGDKVTIFWHPLHLKAGDDSEQVPYIVEAWICQDGQMVFVPASTYQTALAVHDEAGCSETSHARFIAAEKHGYTRRVLVPWPPHID